MYASRESSFGGTNSLENPQTLCSTCNRDKSISEINFRVQRSPLQVAPSGSPRLDALRGDLARDREAWECSIRRMVNFFYRCDAVQDVRIGARGEGFRHWEVTLYPGNDEAWIQPYVSNVVAEIHEARDEWGRQIPEDLAVFSPGSVLQRHKAPTTAEADSGRARETGSAVVVAAGALAKIVGKEPLLRTEATASTDSTVPGVLLSLDKGLSSAIHGLDRRGPWGPPGARATPSPEGRDNLWARVVSRGSGCRSWRRTRSPSDAGPVRARPRW